MYQSTNNLYSIQFVSNVTGINPHTIRAWEKRYGATKPVRDKNGRRLYSDQEIQRLDLLNKLVAIGNNISDIANLEKEKLSEVLKRYKETVPKISKEVDQVAEFDWNTHLQSLLTAIRLRKQEVVVHELDLCFLSLSKSDLLSKLALPLVKELKAILESDLYDEKFVSNTLALVKSKFFQLSLKDSSKKVNNRRKVVVASMNGELNNLMGILISNLFNERGYNVDFFDGKSKVNQVSELIGLMKPDMVYLCTGYSSELENSQENKNNYISFISNSCRNAEIFAGSFEEKSSFKGLDVEFVNDYNYLLSILDNT